MISNPGKYIACVCAFIILYSVRLLFQQTLQDRTTNSTNENVKQPTLVTTNEALIVKSLFPFLVLHIEFEIKQRSGAIVLPVLLVSTLHEKGTSFKHHIKNYEARNNVQMSYY